MSLESLDHIVSGVLFDFAGFLTSREERITLSSSDLATLAADAVSEFMKLRGVSEERPPFLQWNARCAANQNKPKHVAEAIAILSSAIRDDDGYAWGWHCNIAMAFADEGATHEQANKAAARFMSLCFGADTTAPPQACT